MSEFLNANLFWLAYPRPGRACVRAHVERILGGGWREALRPVVRARRAHAASAAAGGHVHMAQQQGVEKEAKPHAQLPPSEPVVALYCVPENFYRLVSFGGSAGTLQLGFHSHTCVIELAGRI